MKTIDVDQAIAFLNHIVQIDREAVDRLIKTRVPCNKSLANHPTVQVGYQENDNPKGDRFEVGFLGIINGLFGIRDDKRGFICAMYEGDSIMRFQRTPEAESCRSTSTMQN